MNRIIAITENEGQQSVNARDLHRFLESKQDFSTWMKKRIAQYGFTQGEDYELIHKKVEQVSGAKSQIDYLISLDMAKELSMVERNAKGKQARQYFIECEKVLRESSAPVLTFEEQVIHTLSLAKEKVEALEAQIVEMKPKAALHDFKEGCGSAIKIKDFTDNFGKQIGQNRFYTLLREWGWVCKSSTSPTQYAEDRDYLKAKSSPFVRNGGMADEKISSRITVKGQLKAIEKMKEMGIIKEDVA